MPNPQPNQLIISIQPDMEISLLFPPKSRGKAANQAGRDGFYLQRELCQPVPEAYETLLLEALECDASLFMRADQVEAAWKVVMPILDNWNRQKIRNF